ncbi:transposable element Tc1 transposase [Trichonephila clavipes]|nr:transposable element Tc1 transposase [Trichonephila clavipes]
MADLTTTFDVYVKHLIHRKGGKDGLTGPTYPPRYTNALDDRCPLLYLPLTRNHRHLRRQWCNERRTWTMEGSDIVCTDESLFCLQHHNGRIRVWRHSGERLLNCCVISEVSEPGGPPIYSALAVSNIPTGQGVSLACLFSRSIANRKRLVLAFTATGMGYTTHCYTRSTLAICGSLMDCCTPKGTYKTSLILC